MSDPFDSPRLTDLKLVETQEPENAKESKEGLQGEPAPQTDVTQGNNSTVSRKKASHLRLVVSNPAPSPLQEEETLPKVNTGNGFTAQIRKKGDNLYTFMARDPAHWLDCRFDLKLHEDEEDLEPMTVTCHFPDMPSEILFDMVGEDETLLGILHIQFQVKVLEKLLLFCSDQTASYLFVYTSHIPEEDHALGIYSTLAAYEGLVPTLTGNKVQIAIPTTTESYDKLLDLMDRLNRDFRQTLWQEQRTSPTIRKYLKSNPGLNFFD